MVDTCIWSWRILRTPLCWLQSTGLQSARVYVVAKRYSGTNICILKTSTGVSFYHLWRVPRRSWTFILANFHTEKVSIHSHLVIFLEMLYTLPNSMIFPMSTTPGMVRYSGYILSRIYPGLPSLALSPATRSRTSISSVPGLEAPRFPSI